MLAENIHVYNIRIGYFLGMQWLHIPNVVFHLDRYLLAKFRPTRTCAVYSWKGYFCLPYIFESIQDTRFVIIHKSWLLPVAFCYNWMNCFLFGLYTELKPSLYVSWAGPQWLWKGRVHGHYSYSNCWTPKLEKCNQSCCSRGLFSKSCYSSLYFRSWNVYRVFDCKNALVI